MHPFLFSQPQNKMEQQSLAAIESFSYSWLSNHKASSSSEHEGTSYNRKGSNRLDFNFDVHDYAFDDHFSIADADELFSDGVMRTVFVNPSKTTADSSNNNNHMKQYSSSLMNYITPSEAVVEPGMGRIGYCRGFMNIKKWRKSTSRVVRRFLGFVSLRRLICHRVGCSRRKSRSRVDDIDRREFEAISRSLDSSPQASPLIRLRTTKSDCSTHPHHLPHDDQYWCHDLDGTSNIYEAVLHCKRSIEK